MRGISLYPLAEAQAGTHQRLLMMTAFWSMQFLLLTAERSLSDGANARFMLLPRLLVAFFGIAASIVISTALTSMRERQMPRRSVIALCLVLIAVPVHGAVNFVVFQLFVGAPNWQAASVAGYSVAVAQWFWTYGCLAMLLLASDYASSFDAARTNLEHLSLRLIRVLAKDSVENFADKTASTSGAATPPAPDSHVWVRQKSAVLRLDLNNVERISAERQYVRIFTGAHSFLHRASLTAIIPLLDSKEYIRIHRSHVISCREIAAIHRTHHGDYRVTTPAGDQLPVGRKYRKVLRSITVRRPVA